jgi:hypothetical protein
MNTDTIESIWKIKTKAVNEINEQCQSFIDDMVDDTHSNVHDFVDLFISWYSDKQKHQWLWELFHNVIQLDDVNVIWSLDHFIHYHLYDDGGYSVWWKTTKFADDTCSLVDKYHTEYVKDSYPVLKHDTDDNYHQDVQLLIDLMNKKQELELNRIKEFEEWNLKLKDLY